MWSQNELTERLNLHLPIFQAPMGGYTTPALAAAVSNAGGLGGLGMWGFSAEDAERRIAGFRQQAGGALNVNYPLWEDPGDLTNTSLPMRELLQAFYDKAELGPLPTPVASAGVVSPDHLAMLQRVKPEVVSFHFGLPDPDIMEAIKAAGIFVLCSATTVAEARLLEARGVDGIIAQGAEAGGHRGTFSGVDISLQPGLFSLLPQVVDAVRVPVIAAGGIADGRTIAAALMLGASAVQLGTAFLRCDEADVPDAYRLALSSANDNSTQVTRVLSGRPARAIRNRLVDELSASCAEPLPFPAQLGLTDPLEASGDQELTPMFAGQSAALSRELPAAELLRTLAEETGRRLAAFD
ncbi:nitronate monooxygenase [Limibaculum sp. M0105]|uniref:Propionate 3-nitronate monooxygenase n=1 Tax=Thermohalobaculum xanthum TaxID=2753746 RepID=A0A8J7SI70_9RHOB|nr:nitronate monooxygenase family protein [Thermohalobaculum xanthum]MBK0401202.1 nitronate monooxygenase [Thermohalobaculum xanthum]